MAGRREPGVDNTAKPMREGRVPMNERPAVRVAEVPVAAAGNRFDRVLADLFREYSRSRLAQWVRDGAVLLDGDVVPVRHLVRGGEQVKLTVIDVPLGDVPPEPIGLDIRYEDDAVLVVDKPPGLVVHPGAGNRAGTLQNALLHHDPRLAMVPRAGIVHRLDKDTSGLLVVAKTLPAHAALVAQLAARSVHRQYLAIVYGRLVAGGRIDASIGRHPRDRLRQAVREDGRSAVTHYRVRERFRALSLLECRLETGRTHQIRVHMAHLHHPLVGDEAYGGRLKLPRGATPQLVAALRGFKRQALHAEKLEFAHPSDGHPVSVTAPPPKDFRDLLAALRDDAASEGKS